MQALHHNHAPSVRAGVPTHHHHNPLFSSSLLHQQPKPLLNIRTEEENYEFKTKKLIIFSSCAQLKKLTK